MVSEIKTIRKISYRFSGISLSGGVQNRASKETGDSRTPAIPSLLTSTVLYITGSENPYNWYEFFFNCSYLKKTTTFRLSKWRKNLLYTLQVEKLSLLLIGSQITQKNYSKRSPHT